MTGEGVSAGTESMLDSRVVAAQLSAPVETLSAPVETLSAPVETLSAPVETLSAPVDRTAGT